ncbi:MAG TPA: DUF2017 family protein [Micromonosporaceae bacterium]|nr:DUF2017 family protein [Micromonosporaceae bacterium]
MSYPGLFHRDGDHCVTTLRATEVGILRRVFTETANLVSDRHSADPAAARLFPEAYPDDVAESEEFRRFTEDELRAEKSHQIGVVLGCLPHRAGQVRLDEDHAEAWLRALTDARLTLGIRMEIDENTDLGAEIDNAAMRDPTGFRAVQLSVYGYLTYVQESLIEALTET